MRHTVKAFATALAAMWLLFVFIPTVLAQDKARAILYVRCGKLVYDRLQQVQFTRLPAPFERSNNGLSLSFQ
jgi:hypothetical protein